MRIKHGVLHVHSRESIFDSINKKTDIIDKVASLGGKAVAITDHGVLSGVLDDLAYAKGKDVKIIYAVEAYVDLELNGILKRTHLILAAKDEKGVLAINQAVTKANANLHDGFPCMTREILIKYFGIGSIGHDHVLATSACVQGSAGTILLGNKIFENECKKVSSKLEKLDYSNDIIHKYEKISKEYSEITLSIDKYKNELEEYKKSLAGKRRTPEQRTEIDRLQDLVKKEINNEKAWSSALKEITPKYELYVSLLERKKELTESQKSIEELTALAEKELLEMESLFGKDNFFIELQYHYLKNEAYVMPILSNIAYKNNIPVIAANDAHLINGTEDEVKARKLASFLRYGHILEENDDDVVDGKTINDVASSLYIKSDEELSFTLKEILPEDVVNDAMENIGIFIDKCFNYYMPDDKYYPVYNKKIDADEEIRRLAYEGIDFRFPNRNKFTKEYEDRLEYELGIICKMGYSDYHLIVREYLEVGRILGKIPDDELDNAPLTSLEELQIWYDEKCKTDDRFGIGIGIGEGRGSCPGSLVCYLLGISGIDPIKYGLLFERFLNPSRVSMPDIDSDFSMEVRERVMKFVVNKYGEAAVCSIMTKGLAGVKSGLRAAGRYFDALADNEELKKSDSDKKAKIVESKVFINKADAISKQVNKIIDALSSRTGVDKTKIKNNEKFDELLNVFSDDKMAIDIIKLAKAFEGGITNTSTHAAGVIIAGNGDVSQCIPLKWNTSNNKWTTQCNMVQAEEMGLLKMDFLGLKTLSILTNMLRMIYENTGKKIDIRQVPFEDEDTVSKIIKTIYSSGNTIGVFQFASEGIRQVLHSINPSTIEDIILINALYRPGPLDYAPTVAEIKNGIRKANYKHPLLKPILEKTYGVMIYQEQVMDVCRILAGYSLGDADNVRRYMSKKKMDKLEHERETFVHGDSKRNIIGCVANGVPENVANSIFDDMIEFAKYAFNKAHAAIYGITSYYTCWGKYYYPCEFYSACMNYTLNLDELGEFIRDAKRYNVNGKKVEVLPPYINKANIKFSTDGNIIYYGLKFIKGFDEKTATAIVEERKKRPFTSFHDFVLRMHLSDKKMQSLINAGAFDEFGMNRKTLLLLSSILAPISEEINDKSKYIFEGKQILELINDSKITTVRDLEKYNFKNFKITSKNPDALLSLSKIETRVKDAENSLLAKKGNFMECKINNVFDDNELATLEEERNLLGFYVSKFPLDNYFTEGIPPINEIAPDTTEVCGIVSNLIINNKGSYMFDLEDKTGIVKCAMYYSKAKAVGRKKELIKNGEAIKLSLPVSVKTYIKKVENDTENTNTDDDDDENGIEETYFMFEINKSSQIDKLKQKETSVYVEVKNIVDFIDNVAPVLNQFIDEEHGLTVNIYDKMFCSIRPFKYRISKNIINSELNVKVEL